jgi:hypothetical protein
LALAATSGARRGQLLALRWKDVDSSTAAWPSSVLWSKDRAVRFLPLPPSIREGKPCAFPYVLWSLHLTDLLNGSCPVTLRNREPHWSMCGGRLKLLPG